MTYNRPTRLEPVSAPSNKPYKLISLSNQSPDRKHPVGRDRYQNKLLSGNISLKLTVKTPTFIAAGMIGLGSDLASKYKHIPLIKVALDRNGKLVIPGSSFKGVVRSAYEAITLSCLCKTKAKQNEIPTEYSECKDITKLCPACRVFGAMGYQGLISFNEAVAEEIKPSVGFMPSLYKPNPEGENYYLKNKVAGRKFYYHAIKAIDRGQTRGIPVQQAIADLTFSNCIEFINLTQAELGVLLTVLGQDVNNSIALKVGGGKPIGMGTMTVKINQIELLDLKSRYTTYDSSATSPLIADKLKEFIAKCIHAASQTQLIQTEALKQLKEVWQFPTQRQAPEGMY